jgi:DNA polymerase-3 subunit epsilon
VESTGLDVNKDEVIEVGAVLWSTGQNKALESVGFLVKAEKAISDEITSITGITQSAVDAFGYESADALNSVIDLMSQADVVIGHNVKRFDERITRSWASRFLTELPDKLWADTMTDLPNVKGEQLVTMAAKHGFVNLFPHSALADCQTVVKLISGYDIEKIIERAKSPTIVVQSHQGRHENDLVKKMQFRWNPERKLWFKCVKEMDLEELKKNAAFALSIVDKLTAEELLAL